MFGGALKEKFLLKGINQSGSLSRASKSKAKSFRKKQKKKKVERKKWIWFKRLFWLCSASTAESEEKKMWEAKEWKICPWREFFLLIFKLYVAMSFFISRSFSFKNAKNSINTRERVQSEHHCESALEFFFVFKQWCDLSFWSTNALNARELQNGEIWKEFFSIQTRIVQKFVKIQIAN